MPSVFDVAAYILEKCGPISAMKLQKLVYYSQAWSLVWDEEILFPEKIEAWANGPVVRELYDKHRGIFKVSPALVGGDPDLLNPDQKETVDVVCEAYCEMNAQMLSDLTHGEAPWRNARRGLSDGDRGSNVISLADMAEYYSSLPPA
ncbi:MAG: Panacea domain-containing protein [Aminivibrio sp.]|jgi:uncharacterized phage-associated protein